MAESERLVRFHLLGQEFAFYTGASEEEMDAILNLVRQQVEDNSTEAGGSIPVSKIAVMACLNIASRYIRLKRDLEEYRTVTETKLQALNEKMERHFSLEKQDEQSF
jgi:cell division protein ZapA